jgi:hypothetical protein
MGGKPHTNRPPNNSSPTCGLVDILTSQHSGTPPPTYARGKKRIDYILVSSSIAPIVHRSGILPFHSIFQSDHRPCFIDIDSDKLFKETTHEIEQPKHRGLQLTDPRKVTRYIDIVNDQMAYHRIPEKCERIKQDALAKTWSAENITTYESIDQLGSEIMRHAEKPLTKQHSKRYVWSPTLARSVEKVRYWRLKLKRSKGLFITQQSLETLLKKAR